MSWTEGYNEQKECLSFKKKENEKGSWRKEKEGK